MRELFGTVFRAAYSVVRLLPNCSSGSVLPVKESAFSDLVPFLLCRTYTRFLNQNVDIRTVTQRTVRYAFSKVAIIRQRGQFYRVEHQSTFYMTINVLLGMYVWLIVHCARHTT